MGTTITENKELVRELKALISELEDRDHEFANSLVDSGKKGKLSEKQLFWVHKLIQRAITGPEPQPKETVAELSGLINLFNHAKQHLKWPKIRVGFENYDFMLSMAGDKSKKPGWINITDGRPYGQNEWYGRISPEGEWEKPQNLDETAHKLLRRMMLDFSKDAAGAATKYGKMTGNCCFCNKGIGEGDDQRSVEAGYGPVCAKNFGLKWGGKS